MVDQQGDDRGRQELFTGCISLGLFLIAAAGIFFTIENEDALGLVAAAVALGFLLLVTVRR
jgi:hypothetical protein